MKVENYEITISMSKQEAIELKYYLKLAINKLMGEMQADRETYAEYEDMYKFSTGLSENAKKNITDTMEWCLKDYDRLNEKIGKITEIRNAITELTRKED